MAYDWPGNVRELRNVLARATLTAPSQVILPAHLELALSSPLSSAGSSARSDLCLFSSADLAQIKDHLYHEVMGEVEKRLVLYALDRTGNNQVHASELLGISRSMLRRRLRDFDLAEPSSDEE